MNKITQIFIDQIGLISADSYGDIVPFQISGEMSNITWYRKGNKEFNGKYVIEIDYENNLGSE